MTRPTVPEAGPQPEELFDVIEVRDDGSERVIAERKDERNAEAGSGSISATHESQRESEGESEPSPPGGRGPEGHHAPVGGHS